MCLSFRYTSQHSPFNRSASAIAPPPALSSSQNGEVGDLHHTPNLPCTSALPLHTAVVEGSVLHVPTPLTPLRLQQSPFLYEAGTPPRAETLRTPESPLHAAAETLFSYDDTNGYQNVARNIASTPPHQLGSSFLHDNTANPCTPAATLRSPFLHGQDDGLRTPSPFNLFGPSPTLNELDWENESLIDQLEDSDDDYHGDPLDNSRHVNTSSVTPLHPSTLIEPGCKFHGKYYYVVTKGLSVGIHNVWRNTQASAHVRGSRFALFCSWTAAIEYYEMAFNSNYVQILPVPDPNEFILLPMKQMHRTRNGSASHPFPISSKAQQPLLSFADAKKSYIDLTAGSRVTASKTLKKAPRRLFLLPKATDDDSDDFAPRLPPHAKPLLIACAKFSRCQQTSSQLGKHLIPIEDPGAETDDKATSCQQFFLRRLNKKKKMSD